MQTVPTQAALTPLQAARAHTCAICWAQPSTPCQRRPEADHLKRYLDAYRDGGLTREDMAAVFDAVEVITKHRLVPAGVTQGDATTGSESCPRCGAVSWGMTPDGDLECTRCASMSSARRRHESRAAQAPPARQTRPPHGRRARLPARRHPESLGSQDEGSYCSHTRERWSS